MQETWVRSQRFLGGLVLAGAMTFSRSTLAGDELEEGMVCDDLDAVWWIGEQVIVQAAPLGVLVLTILGGIGYHMWAVGRAAEQFPEPSSWFDLWGPAVVLMAVLHLTFLGGYLYLYNWHFGPGGGLDFACRSLDGAACLNECQGQLGENLAKAFKLCGFSLLTSLVVFFGPLLLGRFGSKE